MLFQVDPEKDEGFFGWIVTSFSLAGMVFSPIFGVLSNCLGKCKNLIIICSFLLALGSILYAYTEEIPAQGGYYILFVRALLGISNGMSCVCKGSVCSFCFDYACRFTHTHTHTYTHTHTHTHTLGCH